MHVISSGLWQWLPRPGFERFELARDGASWLLRGTIVTLGESGDAEARYEVRCDEGWRTQSADVSVSDAQGHRALHIEAADGAWRVDGNAAPHLDGCIDIDLGWSPSTNTVAIRRLALAIGVQSGPLTMAWVRFPELRVETLGQIYARLARDRYRYESRGGSFRADLTVDEEGLVVDYEGIWRRLHVTRLS